MPASPIMLLRLGCSCSRDMSAVGVGIDFRHRQVPKLGEVYHASTSQSKTMEHKDATPSHSRPSKESLASGHQHFPSDTPTITQAPPSSSSRLESPRNTTRIQQALQACEPPLRHSTRIVHSSQPAYCHLEAPANTEICIRVYLVTLVCCPLLLLRLFLQIHPSNAAHIAS